MSRTIDGLVMARTWTDAQIQAFQDWMEAEGIYWPNVSRITLDGDQAFIESRLDPTDETYETWTITVASQPPWPDYVYFDGEDEPLRVVGKSVPTTGDVDW